MRLSTTRRRLLPALLLAAALGLAPAQAATITVDSDTDDGTGGCTLREAVESANTDAAVGGCATGAAGSDDIVFDAGVTLVQLGSQITITDDVTITGNGAAVTTVSAAAGARIFEWTDLDVSIADIRLSSVGSTAASGYPTHGGAILATGSGSLTVTDATLDNHIASVRGGAISINGDVALTVSGTTFSGNRARGDLFDDGGGAIHSSIFGSMSITNSTFTDNRAIGTAGSGGAILTASVDVDVVGSTFTLNRAQRAGGAIEVSGRTLDVTDTDFDRNTALSNPGNGGAIHAVAATTVITNGSATGNRASAEGGAFWAGIGGSMTVDGTTISGNFAFGDAADTGGGGLYNDGVTLTLTGGSVTGNSALGASGSGGGVFANGGTTTISGTTISDNAASRAGGGIELVGDGTLTVDGGATISDNRAGSAPGNGGGLHITADGTATFDGVTVSGNRARNEGGGLWNSGTGTLTVLRSTVSGNRAIEGGGVYQQAGSPDGTALAIGQSLLLGNNANRGGGLFTEAPTDVTNSTIAANEARYGGGVFSNEADLSLNSVTVARNTARTQGGGLYNLDPQPPPGTARFVTLRNTIVAENTASSSDPNLRGRYGSEDYNVIGTTPPTPAFMPQTNDQVSTDPLLEMLADNGGPTQTLALGAGSPAIDAGDTILTVDQRGEPRSDGSDDVGAYEVGAAPTVALVLTGVIDGPLPGGTPKAIEIYVLEDIADLSAYGVGSANNGTGTDGEEFTFPAVAATAGDYLYVASESPNFTQWFGAAPDYVDGAVNVNGDDAIELFFNGEVVDLFGDINTSGTGQPWEYLDGWAYREDGTGPSPTFDTNDWFYSGPNALDGDDGPNDEGTNDTATPPFPDETYSPVVVMDRTAALATAADAPVSLTASPNPFSTRATASFSVAEAQTVTVALYDVMGRRVQTLFAGPAEAASPVTVAVDGTTLAAGVYVIVLEGERVRTTRPVTVAR